MYLLPAGWSPPLRNHSRGGDEVARRERVRPTCIFRAAVKITEELYFHADTYREALAALRQHLKLRQPDLAQFGIPAAPQKGIQPLLEHFDQRVTRRVVITGTVSRG